MNTVERWEFTRWSGNSPDAVKNAAMEVARLVYYRLRDGLQSKAIAKR